MVIKAIEYGLLQENSLIEFYVLGLDKRVTKHTPTFI